MAADGQLAAFRHDGFWDCMDTYKDAVVLNDLWSSGNAPWPTIGDEWSIDHRIDGSIDHSPSGGSR
jgi:NDP-sugar pyrophosphorylase family protein